MASKVGDYVTNNSVLVLVVLAAIGAGTYLTGFDTITALAAMLFGGVLMWQAGHHVAQEPDTEEAA